MTVNPVSSAFSAYQTPPAAAQQNNEQASALGMNVAEAQAVQAPAIGGNLAPEITASPIQAMNEALQTTQDAAVGTEEIDVTALMQNDQAMLYQADATANQQMAASMTGAGGTFNAFA
jgi:hypothetical protein